MTMNEQAAEQEGIAEMRKELHGGSTLEYAVYRGWITYHNRLGGRRSYQEWREIHEHTNDRKGSTVNKHDKLAKELAPFVARANPLATFQEAVAKAEHTLAKAKATGADWQLASAREELRSARQRLTVLKMMIAEAARERDPALVMRAARGQGVPMISNRHQFPDDSGIRGV